MERPRQMKYEGGRGRDRAGKGQGDILVITCTKSPYRRKRSQNK